MSQAAHDQNFKNLFLDFPKEALEWFLPETLQKWGSVHHVEFLRQEPKKRKLSDAHLILDMPILFTFQAHQLLLWLVEFQEDKTKFSIYKLLRYVTDLMEAHPEALVIPTVLFTERTEWKKDVLRQLDAKLEPQVFLHFEYVFVKLFDYNARDFYNSRNPIIKILLPKMKYTPEERWDVIKQAYTGLFQLASLELFEKYIDFIDVYAEVREDERQVICQELQQHEETIMIAQYIRNEGKQEGLREGLREGLCEGNIKLLSRQFARKYRRVPEDFAAMLEGLNVEDYLELGEYMLDCDDVAELERWIQQRKHAKAAASTLN